jgi:hypothetical protein
VVRMGFTAYTPWIAVRHQDTDYDHIHIVASRWEARKAIAATQELERTHGLTLTAGLGDVRAEKKLTNNEINMAVRTGQEPLRLVLQRLIDEIVNTKPAGALAFAEKLQFAGVEVRPNVASGTGRMNGFSFSYQGIPFKGSDLGKAYTGLSPTKVPKVPQEFLLLQHAKARDVWLGLGSKFLPQVKIIPADDAILDEPFARFGHLLIFFLRLQKCAWIADRDRPCSMPLSTFSMDMRNTGSSITSQPLGRV